MHIVRVGTLVEHLFACPQDIHRSNSAVYIAYHEIAAMEIFHNLPQRSLGLHRRAYGENPSQGATLRSPASGCRLSSPTARYSRKVRNYWPVKEAGETVLRTTIARRLSLGRPNGGIEGSHDERTGRDTSHCWMHVIPGY